MIASNSQDRSDRSRQGQFDGAGVADAVTQMLIAVGERPLREGLAGTPERVARSMAEIFSGLRQDPSEHLKTTFQADSDALVMVRDIQFYSMCEHHLLPFFGRAHIAYLPRDERVVGLSKLARCVDGFARRPQVQERLTTQVADALQDVLGVRGAAVVVQAEHLCMAMRGVSKTGTETVTMALRGDLSYGDGRREALDLLRV